MNKHSAEIEHVFEVGDDHLPEEEDDHLPKEEDEHLPEEEDDHLPKEEDEHLPEEEDDHLPKEEDEHLPEEEDDHLPKEEDEHLPEEEDEDEEEENVVASKKRIRTMTKRGLAYSKDNKISKLHQLSRVLEKYMKVIMDLMDREAKSSDVLRTYKVWLALFDRFLETDISYRDLLTDDELDVYTDDWFDTRNTVMVDFKDTAMNWLAKNTKRDEKSKKSYVVSGLAHSVGKASRHSPTKSKKSRKEDMQAQLEAKVKALKKRQELEQEKLNLKMKEEQLQLEEEMSKLCDEDSASESSRSQISSAYSLPSSTSSHRRQKHCGSKTSQDSCLSDALVSVVRRLNRPTVELSKFDGDPLRYSRFMRQFKTKIVVNCDSYDDMLCYLEQYTVGEPHQIVIGCSYMEAKEGYKTAIKELDERYGDQDVIVNAYVNKALKWSTIKADNPKELDRFAVFLKECCNAVKSINVLEVLEYSENLKTLVMKLPFSHQEKWRNLVAQTKEKGQRVKFQHLVDLVVNEDKEG